MDIQLLASLNEVDELGNDLLRILVRAVDVVGTSNDNRHLEGVQVTLADELSSSLGSSVGVGGVESSLFKDVVLALQLLTVDFIGGDVDETLDVVNTSRFQENVSTNDIVVGESKAVTEGVV